MKDAEKYNQTMFDFIKISISYYTKHSFQLLTALLFAQASIASALTDRESALEEFGDCLEKNNGTLEVRNLIDIYRVRGIPEQCCTTLADRLFSDNLTKLPDGIDRTNCRINAFFISGGIFDAHNHPLEFSSLIVHGGYLHAVFEEKLPTIFEHEDFCLPCTPGADEICSEHSRIHTKSDTIEKVGTARLLKIGEEYFGRGDFHNFNNTKSIHRIESFEEDTMTVNYISTKGDQKIDVFVSHATPERNVLSKADTRAPLEKEISFNIIKKCISFFKPVSIEVDTCLSEHSNRHHDCVATNSTGQ